MVSVIILKGVSFVMQVFIAPLLCEKQGRAVYNVYPSFLRELLT